LVSALLHALWNFSTKGSRNPLAFAMLLSATTSAGVLVLLPFFNPREIPAEVWWILFGSVAVHTVYFYCLAKGYQSGDLSLVYPIARSTPAFVPLIAVPLLGERLSALGVFGIAIVVVGIWLLHAEGWRWRSLTAPGMKFALLTLATTVAYSILDKEGMARLNEVAWSGSAPRALVFLFLIETMMFFLFFPLALREVGREGLARVVRTEFRSVAGAAIASVVSYTLILEAFRTASVSYVVAVRQSSVLFALVLSLIFLRERPSRARLVGAVATVAGVALVSFA
jgi:drug/metabolite transporter (DMT)-like permease